MMQRVHGGQRAILLVLVVALLLNPLAALPAQAQTSSVAMSKSQWGKTIWMADWMQQYQGNQRVRATVLTMAMLDLYRTNPNLSQQEAHTQMQALDDEFMRTSLEGRSIWEEQARTAAETALMGVNAISQVFGPGEMSNAIAIEGQQFANALLWEYSNDISRVEATHKLYLYSALTEGDEQTYQTQALTLAQQNANFAQAYNDFFNPKLEIQKAGTDTSTLIAQNPNLIPQAVKDRIITAGDGSILIAVNDVKQAIGDQAVLINQVIAGQRGVAQQIDQLQKDFKSYKEDIAKQEQAKQIQQATAQVDALKLKAAQSGVYIVSTLIGVVDPKLGKQVSTVGNAGIQIAQSFMDYTKTMSELGKLVDKLDGKIMGLASSLGAVVLTGNVLAAVMEVVSLFQESGPTDEQLILQQVGELRQQVDQMRHEMHDRFDRVDKQLNIIYGDMMSQFALINITQWQIRTDIHDMQNHLLDIEMDLHAIEAQMSEWIQDDANSRLYERINYVMGYQDRFPVPMEPTTYYDYQNSFYHWATLEAKNAINAGSYDLPPSEYTEAERILAQLSHPLDQNLNYLATWLAVHGIGSFTDRRLANPQIWALSTRTYSQMKYDWPAYALMHDPNKAELTQIRQVGTDLSNAVRAITTVPTAQGPRGNRPLFAGVTNYYTSTLSGLDSALQGAEVSYIQPLLANVLKQPNGILDFWGGPDQSMLDYQPANLWCDDTGLAAPATLLAWIPAPYLVRNFLTTPEARQSEAKLDSCWGADWADQRIVTQATGKKLYYGKLRVELYARYQNTVISTYFYQGNEELFGTCAPNPAEPDGSCVFHDAEEIVTNNWTSGRSYKALLESNGAPSSITELEQQQRANLLAQVSAEDMQRLREHQKGIYQAILAALSQATPSRAAGHALQAANLVVTDLIRLGMPRALTTDEYLRAFLEGGDTDSHQRLAGDAMLTDWYTAAYYSLLQDEGQTLTASQQALVDWYREEYSAQSSQQPVTLNPRSVLQQAITARVVLLNQHLEEYFKLVDSGDYQDSEPLVEMTLLQLDVYDKVARMAHPAPQPEPTAEPTAEPTVPTAEPTEPTAEPTAPTAEPTEPTAEPTAPTAEPTEPTAEPTEPTAEPTEPTAEPTEPTVEPTEPTAQPTSPMPTETATPVPPVTGTPVPGETSTPAVTPTVEPTEEPTVEPTAEPTEEPTAEPTGQPSTPAGSVWIDGQAGGEVTGEAGMAITLDLPAGFYSGQVEVKVLAVDEPPATAGRQLLGQVFSVVASDEQHNAVTHFDKPYTLVIDYVDAASLNEEHISLYAWDGVNWAAVPTTVDSANNRLSVSLEQPGIFAGLESATLLYLPSVQTNPPPAQAAASAAPVEQQRLYVPVVEH